MLPAFVTFLLHYVQFLHYKFLWPTILQLISWAAESVTLILWQLSCDVLNKTQPCYRIRGLTTTWITLVLWFDLLMWILVIILLNIIQFTWFVCLINEEVEKQFWRCPQMFRCCCLCKCDLLKNKADRDMWGMSAYLQLNNNCTI